MSPSHYIFNQSEKYARQYGDIKNIKYIAYQKLPFMTQEEIDEINPSLIVFDEFHRCGAPEWGKGIQKLLDSFPNAKILGTSATPIRYLDNKRDMSDELFDGNVISYMDFWDAVLDGILPTPMVVNGLYSLNEESDKLINDINNNYNSEVEKVELKLQYENMKNQLENSHGIPEIFKKHIKDCNGKFIVFCKNVEHLKKMQNSVVEWFSAAKLTSNGINTYKVYSEYPNKSKEFERFENDDSDKLKLLFSISMLNEGIHVPKITGVVFLRDTISPIIFLQQLGRVVTTDGVKHPLVFDLVNNCDNVGGYQEGLQKAIEKRNYSNEEKHRIMEEQDFYIHDYTRDFVKLCEDIREKLDDYWMYMYKKLNEYKEINGNCNVPRRLNKLGEWCTRQRKQYNNGMLSKEKINLLENIGFIWDVLEIQWLNMFNELVEYKKIHGDCNVQINSDKLAMWCNSQRQKYKKGLLSKEKIMKLESVGFVFSLLEMQWLKMLNDLKT